MTDKTTANDALKAVSKRFIGAMAEIKLSKAGQNVNVVPQINITTDESVFKMTISFKIGLEKLYVVRDIYEFLDIIGTNRSIEFGKSFIYDDSRHTFEHYIDKILNMLSVSMRKNAGNMTTTKEFVLSGALKNSVLRILAGKPAEIIIDGKIQADMQIVNDNIPFAIELLKEDDGYRMAFDEISGVTPISDDCSICLWQGDIYVVPLEQAGCIKALIDAKNACGETVITFAHEDKTNVILKVLPKLRVASNLQIDSKLKNDVIVGDLKVKTYVDKTEDGYIAAKILFCYDNLEFNHFAGEKPVLKKKVLLRDRRAENAFIKAAASCGFKPYKGLLYIKENYRIYEFMNEKSRLLAEFGEIYYSETFDLKIVSPSRASAGVHLDGGNLLEFDISFDEINMDELPGVLEAVREKSRYYRLKNGSFVNLSAQAIKKSVQLLDSLDVQLSHIDGNSVSVPVSRAFYINKFEDEDIKISRDEYFDNFISRFADGDTEVCEVPQNLKSVMRPYQIAGLKWLTMLANYNMGGILADEMGLGKTLQTIAFVMQQYAKYKKPTLIVAPTSLLYNWQAEIEKFTPGAKVCIVSGTPAERKQISKKFDSFHFVITSYGLLRRDIDLYTGYKFAYCFVDEAQHIKNPATINSKAVKKIKAGGYFALTGTPLENTLTELWSIFDFVMPGYLYSRHKFRKMYEVPIVKENDRDSLADLLKHTKPFVLRRLKTQVMKELPDKIESRMVSELEPEQKQLYAAYALQAKNEIDVLAENGGFERNRIKILALITRLRQLCCHPSLFVENYDGTSGKIEMLKEIVENALSDGHRIIIFSQFTTMLKIISEMLSEIGVEHYYLDGSTKSKDRIELVNTFNKGGADVFLISLKAGGTGINLTGADMVIHYDPWWNPAVENQATDRAHRIGQTKTVQVLKLVAKGTIEEKIYNLQKLKQNMIDSVLESGETMLSSMTLEEIKSLFD